MLSGADEASLLFVLSTKTSSGSNPRASHNASNCGIDGRKSSFSRREINARRARGGGGKSRNIMINNIGGGWERNENSMFKSRKMSKFVDGFILK